MARAQPFRNSSIAPDPERRLLLLSFYYPPNVAAGALRWEKLTAHAAQRGWAIDVITLDPKSIAVVDPKRLEQLPATTRVFGVSLTASRVERAERLLLSAIRRLSRSKGTQSNGTNTPPPLPAAASGDSATPQLIRREQVRWGMGLRDLKRVYYSVRDIGEEDHWARAAALVGEELAREGHYRAVITCGPPHMVHEAGRRVSLSAGIPLVVDQRDAWSITPVLKNDLASPAWLRLSHHYERRVVRHASLVVANTAPLRDALQSAFAKAEERVITVLNGFDDDGTIEVPERPQFVIAYAGNIYIDRNPRLFFRAVRAFLTKANVAAGAVRLLFVGQVGGDSLLEVAREEGVGEYIDVRSKVRRSELFEMLTQASVLLSLPQEVDLAIPSKIFEYMQFPAWLLALARPGTATEMLLRGTGADVCDPNDVEGISAVLEQRYREYRAGTTPPRVAATAHCSRAAQAEILFNALDTLVLT